MEAGTSDTSSMGGSFGKSHVARAASMTAAIRTCIALSNAAGQSGEGKTAVEPRLKALVLAELSGTQCSGLQKWHPRMWSSIAQAQGLQFSQAS